MFVDYGNKYLTPAKKMAPVRRGPFPGIKAPRKTPTKRPYSYPAKRNDAWRYRPPLPERAGPQPMQRYELPVARITSKVATKVLLRTATKLNPYLRVATTLWDVYDWYNTDPYEWMTPPGGGDLKGFKGYELMCEVPFETGTYGNGFTWVFNGPEYPALCELSGQVVREFGAETLPNLANTIMYGPIYFYGGGDPADPGQYRMMIAKQWARPIDFPFQDPEPEYAPAYALPMPATLTPPRSVAVEEPRLDRAPPDGLPPPVQGLPPYVDPAIEYGPQGKRPVLHVRARPERGKPEKKVRLMGPIGTALAAGFHGLTEWKDFVESIHDALPKKYQSKNGGLLPMENAIWKNFDKIDWAQAVQNVIWNQIEDAIIGGLHGAQKKKFDKIYAMVRGKNGVRLGGYEPRFSPPNVRQ